MFLPVFSFFKVVSPFHKNKALADFKKAEERELALRSSPESVCHAVYRVSANSYSAEEDVQCYGGYIAMFLVFNPQEELK